MLKYISTILLGILFCQNAIAQKQDTIVYYADYSGKKTDLQMASKVIEIFPVIDTSGQKLYPVQEYYLHGGLQLKTLSKTNDPSNLVFVGSCMTFFKNGNEEVNANYVNGQVRGKFSNYYPNRQFYDSEKFNKEGIHLLIDCSDSTGKVLAENGEGKWLKYADFYRSKVYEEGMIKDSLEEGEWKVTLSDRSYTVVYHKGELVSSTDPQNTGKEPVYAVVDTQARFSQKGDSYANFLVHNLKMPASARENNTQGKVVTTFVVEKDGTTSSFITVKSVSKDLDDECIRVLKLMPFIPAIKNGKPVRSYFTLPINFSISNG